MSLALYLDQHVPVAITRGLQRVDVDVLTAEDDERADWDDARLLDRAGELGRLLFTRDSDSTFPRRLPALAQESGC